MKSRTQLSDFTVTFHFHVLGKEMATYSSVLAWRIPGTGESGWLPSRGLHRVGHDWSDLAAAMAQWVKNLAAIQETLERQVWVLGQENPLEEEMATHSSILAWKISRIEEPVTLQSMGLQTVGHKWVSEHAQMHTGKHSISSIKMRVFNL